MSARPNKKMEQTNGTRTGNGGAVRCLVVPPGISVAHKTGSITRIHHDAAIVYGPRPYVIVVLVRGIQDQKVSGALMASISREVWDDLSK